MPRHFCGPNQGTPVSLPDNSAYSEREDLVDVTQHPLWPRQEALENEMRDLGYEAFWRGVKDAQEHGRESSTLYGILLMKQCIDRSPLPYIAGR